MDNGHDSYIPSDDLFTVAEVIGEALQRHMSDEEGLAFLVAQLGYSHQDAITAWMAAAAQRRAA